MRAVLLTLFSWALSCTLVVDGRIEEYEGACADEEEGVRGRYGPEDNRRDLSTITRECVGCVEEDCVELCIHEDTDGEVSVECGACFADATICIGTFCAGRCDGDREDLDCLRCACEHECTQVLNDCSGLVLASCAVFPD